MKREIKFRGYINNQRVFNNIDIETICKSEAVRNYDWSKLKIVEYTGIKDKNGVEIYEGDIVKITKTYFSEDYVCIKEIRFVESSARFHAINTLYSNLREYIEDTTGKNTSEVIGNIYENPELLEQCKY